MVLFYIKAFAQVECGDKPASFESAEALVCASSFDEAGSKAIENVALLECSVDGKCSGNCASSGNDACVYVGSFGIDLNYTFPILTGKKCDNGEDEYTVLIKNPSGNLITFMCKCDCCSEREGSAAISTTTLEEDPCESCTECSGGNLVQLSSFTAIPSNRGISLSWSTETELDSQGFKIWRAIPKLDSYCGCSKNIEDYTQIQVLDKKGKPILIPAEGNKTSGHDYFYLDKNAKPGIAYCYALEDIDSKGKSKFYFKYIAFTQNNLEQNEETQ